MEIGRIADIDNAKVNNLQKLEKVSNVDEKNKVIQEDEYKKSLGTQTSNNANEVLLDNVTFGYNKNSKDFFVKVTRGESVYKYPTEDMMKVKALVLEELAKNKE